MVNTRYLLITKGLFLSICFIFLINGKVNSQGIAAKCIFEDENLFCLLEMSNKAILLDSYSNDSTLILTSKNKYIGDEFIWTIYMNSIFYVPIPSTNIFTVPGMYLSQIEKIKKHHVEHGYNIENLISHEGDLSRIAIDRVDIPWEPLREYRNRISEKHNLLVDLFIGDTVLNMVIYDEVNNQLFHYKLDKPMYKVGKEFEIYDYVFDTINNSKVLTKELVEQDYISPKWDLVSSVDVSLNGARFLSVLGKDGSLIIITSDYYYKIGDFGSKNSVKKRLSIGKDKIIIIENIKDRSYYFIEEFQLIELLNKSVEEGFSLLESVKSKSIFKL